MKTIELHAIDLESERRTQAPSMGTELDDLERPVETEAPAAEIHFYAITVMVDALRSFYPRKHGKPGTRLVYHNGAAEVVTETYDEVKAKLNSLNN